MKTLNDNYQLAETRRVYWKAGFGLFEVNHSKSGLLDSPPYCSISSPN